MSPTSPTPHYDRDSRQLIRRLLACGGYLTPGTGGWEIFSRKNGFSRPVGRAEAALVATMCARGHLVERSKDRLVPREARQAESGRFLAGRSERPEEGALRPSYNDGESPLAWLRTRKLVDDAQFLAGERLRADYERAHLQRRVTASWDPAGTAGSDPGNRAADLTDACIAARQRLHSALDSVGPELASILVQICCLSAGLEQAERILELPRRSGKAVLVLALTALARHYGLLGRQPGRHTRTEHWALEDFRPSIAGQAAG
jgi:hypothetical protein